MNKYMKKTAQRGTQQNNAASIQTKMTNGIPNSVLNDVFAGKRRADSSMMGHSQNLAPSIAAKMSRAFGMDLTGMQVYQSDAMKGTGMRGMAQGNKVVLSSEVNLNTTAGQAVLGHEISHIHAQSQGIGMGHSGLYENAALEHQADTEGLLAAQGRSIYSDGMDTGIGMQYGLGMRGVEGLTPLGSGMSASAGAPMQAWKFGDWFKNLFNKKKKTDAAQGDVPQNTNNKPNKSRESDKDRYDRLLQDILGGAQLEGDDLAFFENYNSQPTNGNTEPMSDSERQKLEESQRTVQGQFTSEFAAYQQGFAGKSQGSFDPVKNAYAGLHMFTNSSTNGMSNLDLLSKQQQQLFNNAPSNSQALENRINSLKDNIQKAGKERNSQLLAVSEANKFLSDYGTKTKENENDPVTYLGDQFKDFGAYMKNFEGIENENFNYKGALDKIKAEQDAKDLEKKVQEQQKNNDLLNIPVLNSNQNVEFNYGDDEVYLGPNKIDTTMMGFENKKTQSKKTGKKSQSKKTITNEDNIRIYDPTKDESLKKQEDTNQTIGRGTKEGFFETMDRHNGIFTGDIQTNQDLMDKYGEAFGYAKGTYSTVPEDMQKAYSDYRDSMGAKKKGGVDRKAQQNKMSMELANSILNDIRGAINGGNPGTINNALSRNASAVKRNKNISQESELGQIYAQILGIYNAYNVKL